MSIKCTVIIQKEENWYVATDAVSGVASQGKTIDESLANLKEALELYYENNLPETNPSPIFVTTMEVAV
ncbi:MAG: type II toxin-antitoxin system HicB family antitoxin [Clostridia bacterium]|nr:type II toxin-antitoxin system HicB family antitoxin [Clostridia bacterium]